MPLDVEIESALDRMAGASGAELLDAALETLAFGLPCRWAALGRPTADGQSIEVVRSWAGGSRGAPFRFELAAAPCAALYRGSAPDRYSFARFCGQDLAACWPFTAKADDLWYRGEAILDADDKPVAHVFAIGGGSCEDDPGVRALFRLVAHRAGAEYKLLTERQFLTLESQRSGGRQVPVASGIDPERLLATILDYSSVAIVTRALDGTVIGWNKAAERLYGYSAEEMVGQLATKCVPEDRSREFDDITKKIERGDRIDHLVTERICKDGSKVTVAASIAPIKDEEGRVIGVCAINHDVTDLKSMELDLRRSRMILGQAHQLAGLGYWVWDAKTKTTELSSEASRILGVDVDEVVEIGGHEYVARFVHADDRARVRRVYREAMGQEISYSLNYRILRTDGQIRDVREWGEGVADEDGRMMTAVGILQDVTAVKSVQRALKDSETRFRDFAEAASDWVWELEPDLTFSYLSAGVEQVTGFSPDLYMGSSLEDSILGPGTEERRELLRDLQNRRVFRGLECQIATVDGQEAWVRLSGNPRFDRKGRFEGYRGIGSDITLRKLAERSLREAKERAEQADLTKTRFLAAASHDLRQPIHALKLMLAALKDVKRESERAAILAEINGGVTSMGDILNALLDVSELDAGGVRPNVCSFALQDVLESAVSHLAPQAAAKGLRVDLVTTTAVARSDPALLSRIVENLLANAVQYTESGRILLGCRRRDEAVRVEVWDTGVGISEDQLKTIFEEFYQLQNPGRDRSKGLGLGLTIVDRLVRLLDHRIEVRSVPGMGSAFAVELPEGGLAMPGAAAQAVYPLNLDMGGKTVLLIEDDVSVLQATARLLGAWGLEVLTAVDHEAAMARLADYGGPPDVMLVDLRLPGGVSGIDSIERIRSRYASAIPAIVMTAETGNEQLRQVGSRGLPVVGKPADPAHIRAKLEESLAAPRPGRAKRRANVAAAE